MLKEYTVCDVERLNSFRALLEKYCDWSYQWDVETHQGMLFPVRTTVYYIKYDEGKLRDNWGTILSEIKKKLCYRKADEHLKSRIDAIPESVEAYTGRASVYYDDRNFLFSGALYKMGSFRWEVKNQFEGTVKDFTEQVKEMKHPLVRFREYNGWERESWNFYMDYPTSEEEILALDALNKRFRSMKPVDQKLGMTGFQVILAPTEYENVRWDSKATSYIKANTYLEGKLDTEFVKKMLASDDSYIFDTLYKGRFPVLVK